MRFPCIPHSQPVPCQARIPALPPAVQATRNLVSRLSGLRVTDWYSYR